MVYWFLKFFSRKDKKLCKIILKAQIKMNHNNKNQNFNSYPFGYWDYETKTDYNFDYP